MARQRVAIGGAQLTGRDVADTLEGLGEGELILIAHPRGHGGDAVVATATGDGAVGFVDAEDIAAVAAVALLDEGHTGEIYDVTGPEAMSFADAAAIIGQAAGRSIAHRKITGEEFTQILVGAGLAPDYAAIVVGNQLAIRDGLGAAISDTVPRLTGRPARTFTDYAAKTAPTWARPIPSA